MISIFKNTNVKTTKNGEASSYEIRCSSSDEKPTTINGKTIDNGTALIEIDTQKIFFFDEENQEWKGV